jgi:hypothetical protein
MASQHDSYTSTEADHEDTCEMRGFEIRLILLKYLYLPFPIMGKFLYENLIPNTMLTELTSRKTTHTSRTSPPHYAKPSPFVTRCDGDDDRSIFEQPHLGEAAAYRLALCTLAVSNQHVSRVQSIQKVSAQLPQEENGHDSWQSLYITLVHLTSHNCRKQRAWGQSGNKMEFCPFSSAKRNAKPLGKITADRVTEEIHRARIYIYPHVGTSALIFKL